MRKLLYITLLLIAVGCGGTDPAEVASAAAKEYYKLLLEGKYDEYVDGFYRPDSIPGSYRSQLIDNAKMFMAQQKEERRGLLDVRVVSAKVDTSLHVANVFLILSYGDSTNEEIVVPMVEQKGVWYMR